MISHAEVQAALSARIDGEDTGLDNTVIDAHLDHCPECSSFWERSLALSRSLSFVEADGSMAPPEDLSDVIYAGVETEFHKLASRRLLGLSIGRVILAILALSLIHI